MGYIVKPVEFQWFFSLYEESTINVINSQNVLVFFFFFRWNPALEVTDWKIRTLWLTLFFWFWGLIYFSITMLVSSLLWFRKSQCSSWERLIFLTCASHLPDPGLNLTTLASSLCLFFFLFCKYLVSLITKNSFFFF